MFDPDKLPESIKKRIAGLTWQGDDIGMSDSTIMLFDEMVLKIEKVSRSSEHEKLLLGWLDGKLPVPSIIAAKTQGAYSFLLMSRLSGEMACSDKNMRGIEDTVTALARGIKMLWEINIADCPCSNTIAEKLVQAEHNIANNLVDWDAFNPETLTTEGFEDVSDLLRYLDRNRPIEDLVFSHGDFCLPNVFTSGANVSGFLDWGSGGIADRWQDIALCVRSLWHNYTEDGLYGEAEYQKYKALLFQELGLTPDEEKIRYYILLDELF